MTATICDVDRRAVIEELRGAIAASGLPQYRFAEAIGTSAPRLSTYLSGATSPSAALLMKAGRLGRAFGAARAERVPTPLDASTSLRRAVTDGARPGEILRLVLEVRDRLRDTLTRRPHLVDVWDARVSTGDRRWDTLVAAIVEDECERHGRPVPPWTAAPALAEEWMPAPGRFDEDQVRHRTPAWLVRKNILIAEDALGTA